MAEADRVLAPKGAAYMSVLEQAEGSGWQLARAGTPCCATHHGAAAPYDAVLLVAKVRAAEAGGCFGGRGSAGRRGGQGADSGQKRQTGDRRVAGTWRGYRSF